MIYDEEIEDGVNYLVYQHAITLSKDDEGNIQITHEALKQKTANKYITIIEQNNGELMDSCDVTDAFQDACKNLLHTQSFLNIFLQTNKNLNFSTKDLEMFFGEQLCLGLFMLALSILELNIILNESDYHDNYEENSPIRQLDQVILHQHFTQRKFYMSNPYADVIQMEDEKQYLDKIKRLTSFMKLLKDDLLDIEVETKERKDDLICEKYFVYPQYRINIEYESTGIKKLVRLFDALEAFVNGEIVFIDEFDANIHDVILLKLLEYFTNYGQGQLCFTTHNLGPMEILKKQKHAIDFLSQDSHITPWKKNGHYSVINLYRDGLIDHNPFHLEAIDFSGIFEVEVE